MKVIWISFTHELWTTHGLSVEDTVLPGNFAQNLYTKLANLASELHKLHSSVVELVICYILTGLIVQCNLSVITENTMKLIQTNLHCLGKRVTIWI